MGWDDPDIQDEKQCRRTSWHRDLPINCNSVHEYDIYTRFSSGDTKFLGYVRWFGNGLIRLFAVLSCSGHVRILTLGTSLTVSVREPIGKCTYQNYWRETLFSKSTFGTLSMLWRTMNSCAWMLSLRSDCTGVRGLSIFTHSVGLE